MLDELGREMCAGFIASYDPNYISVDNPDDNGRMVADCGVKAAKTFTQSDLTRKATQTVWDAISALSAYGPNTEIDMTFSENSDEKVYIIRVPKIRVKGLVK